MGLENEKYHDEMEKKGKSEKGREGNNIEELHVRVVPGTVPRATYRNGMWLSSQQI